MSKSIDLHLSQIKFPFMCVVCRLPATQAYRLQKIFTYGRRSYTIKLDVPMCDLHFHSASCKSKAEKFLDKLGAIIGALAGLAVAMLLLLHWQRTGQGNIFTELFVGGLFGLGIFLLVWALISLVVAPLFAEPHSKAARQAVRFIRYWPKDQFVRLKFQNEQLADIVRNSY